MLAIFDFDGTLFDSSAEWIRLVEASMYKNNVEIPTNLDLYSILKPLGVRKAAAYLINEYKWNQTIDDVFCEWMQSLRDLYLTTIPLKKGAIEYVEFLKTKDIKICLATAMENDLIEAAIERVGLKEQLDAVVTTHDLSTDKNSTKIYNYCMNLFAENKDSTWIYEDSPDVVKMCTAAGFRVIGVYDGKCEGDIELMKPVCELLIYDFRDALISIRK